MELRLQRAFKKLEKYTKKLAKSPYYLAARILNPENRTSFLDDDEIEKEKYLFVVRQLWKRFHEKEPLI